MDKILLIDAHNAMWRASIGFAPKKEAPAPEPSDSEWTMRGESAPAESEAPTEDYVLIFNFFRNLRPIIEQFSPDKCFFVLEGHPQFRYDLFADYKANRIIKRAAPKEKEKLDKFFANKEEIVRLMQHLPITTARAAQYECDDVIATLCENMKEESLTVLSNDSDYIQLLQRGYRHCQIYNPIKKVFMEAPSYHYVAWKCLNGDKSDNISSLLTPKKALAAVSTPEIFQKFMDSEENRANFNINRQLIEFRSVPEEEIVLQEGTRNFAKLKEEFAKMHFESIINDKSWKRYVDTFDCIKY